LNLKSKSHELIFHKVHDCIALFYGSQNAFKEVANQEQGTLYLTRGFIESEDGTCHLLEYPKYKDKFGESKAKEYMKKILIHYRRVVLLNTGAYEMSSYERIVRDFAGEFELDYEEMRGSKSLFSKMIQGQWDENVGRVFPGEEIGIEHFI
jgi:hypothetical protein